MTPLSFDKFIYNIIHKGDGYEPGRGEYQLTWAGVLFHRLVGNQP